MTTATAQSLGLALNFQGDQVPDWVQLTPAGPNIDGRDGRKWTLPNPEAVVAAFRDHGADLPIDIEHSTQIKGTKGDPAPAVGWIKDLEVRNGAIWGQVDWTEDGATALASRAYRYLSPVFRFEPARGEILKMTSAGLTNQPNLHLEALNTEADQKETTMDKAIAEALGLNSDATAADAVVAINKLKEDKNTALNSAQHPDPDKFVPKADYDLALNRISDFEAKDSERQDEAINAALDAAIADKKIAPASREFYEATCRAEGGLERFNGMIAKAPAILGDSGLDGKSPGGGAARLNDEQLAVCRALDQDPEEFAKALAADNKE